MIDKFLRREDVKKFLLDIVVTESRFGKKQIPNTICDEKIDISEYDLLLGLDAIVKYAIIIEDEIYFKSYLESIKKLLKKVESHNDIKLGITRIIINSCREKLMLSNITDLDNKNKIVDYIYKKYINDGYLFYSFSSNELKNIEENGIIVKDKNIGYINEVNKVLKKYKLNQLDISGPYPYISVTDSPFMALFYAYNSPFFMKEFTTCLLNKDLNDYKTDAFFKKNYVTCHKNLAVLARKKDMFMFDKDILYKFLEDNWINYDINNSFPVFSTIKRKEFGKDNLKEYDRIINSIDSKDLVSIVDSILDTRYNNLKIYNNISPLSLNVYKLPSLEELNIKRINLENKANKTDSLGSYDFINEFGNTTILALLGVLFITLGITITIIMLG